MRQPLYRPTPPRQRLGPRRNQCGNPNFTTRRLSHACSMGFPHRPPPWAPPTHHDRGYRPRSRSPATSFVLVLVLLILIVCVVRFLMFGLVLFGGCCTCCCERGARKDLNRGSVVIPVTQ